MRTDKFLKVTRIIKRRVAAKGAAEGERVIVNGRVVKPSYFLKVGDEIEIIFGDRSAKIRVVSVCEKLAKREPQSLYEGI